MVCFVANAGEEVNCVRGTYYMENTQHTGTRIYIPLWLGVLLLVGFVLIALLVGFLLYGSFNKPRLFGPKDEFSSLGTIKGGTKIAQDDNVQKIADTVTDHMNQETKNKLTLIFFYDGYGTQKEALDAIHILQESLHDVEPFKSVQDLIAYKILTTDGKKCSVEKSMLICDAKLIESFKKFGVDHFKVVLLSPEYFTPVAPLAHGANTFITFSTFNNTLTPQDHNRWMGVQFTQLLGRSLGLYSEYVDAESLQVQGPPPQGAIVKISNFGKPNCAKDMKTAEEWWGGYTKIFPKVSYHQGCGGDKSYYYPEKNTLMSDIPRKQGYGIVSEDYLRGVLSCFYGEKESLIFPAGFSATYSASLKSCSAFTKDYPRFWEE